MTRLGLLTVEPLNLALLEMALASIVDVTPPFIFCQYTTLCVGLAVTVQPKVTVFP